MSAEFYDEPVSEQEQQPTRRQMLIQLARREGSEGAVQAAIDAEEILDGQKTAVLLKDYGWTSSQYTRAVLLSEKYSTGIQGMDESSIEVQFGSDLDLGRADLSGKSIGALSLVKNDIQQPRRKRTRATAAEVASRPLKWPRPNPNVLSTLNPDSIKLGTWVLDAACGEKGIDPELFDASPNQKNPSRLIDDKAREAIAICGGCAVRQACFTDAIINNETESIKGGYIPRHLRYLRKKYIEDLEKAEVSA